MLFTKHGIPPKLFLSVESHVGEIEVFSAEGPQLNTAFVSHVVHHFVPLRCGGAEDCVPYDERSCTGFVYAFANHRHSSYRGPFNGVTYGLGIHCKTLRSAP
jgi:hypothetical protein